MRPGPGIGSAACAGRADAGPATFQLGIGELQPNCPLRQLMHCNPGHFDMGLPDDSRNIGGVDYSCMGRGIAVLVIVELAVGSITSAITILMIEDDLINA